MKHLKNVRRILMALALVGLWSSAGLVVSAQATDEKDGQIQSDIAKVLNKSRFKDVKAQVHDGILVLSGTVSVYEDKSEIDHKAHRIKNIHAVDNRIEVAGPVLADRELEQKLVEKLQYDRVGYGNVFNAIGVHVQNGVVTLKGTARTPVDKDSAIALVSSYPGVKDVEDEIEVQPPSPMDDQIRLAVARAVYGFPSLNKYAMDPAKPIRISVENGHVTLYGVVDSQADKDAANIRANSVPGIFSVTNNLMVAGQPSEKK